MVYKENHTWSTPLIHLASSVFFTYIARWGSWKIRSKVANIGKLFLYGFWPKSSKILQHATLTPKKSKSMQILENIWKNQGKNAENMLQVFM